MRKLTTLLKHLDDQAGYSLVEVMASIMILAIAIIPMVGMFDMGLTAASTSGNYDKARAFANKQLEDARSLKYDDARDKFPVSSSTPNPAYGPATHTAGVPSGLTSYTITKRYVDKELANISVDEGIMKVTVTVNWGTGQSYTTTGIVMK